MLLLWPTRRTAALILFLVVLTSCAPPHAFQRTPEVHLTLLATTDLHGTLEPSGKHPETGRPLGGSEALAAILARERQSDPAGTLILDAGDLFQGTALSNLTRGRVVIDVLNTIGYDAAAVGNHEFDWGVPVLAERMREARFPLLIANVIEKQSGRAPPWAHPYRIFERKGVRIAVIGLTTSLTGTVGVPQFVEPYEFLPPAEVANRLIRELVPKQADVAVLLCHLGAFRRGEELTGELVEVARAVPAAAAIVAGHTHQTVAEKVAGIPVVQPGSHGRALGRIDLRIDRASKRVLESRVQLVPIYADESGSAPEVKAVVERHQRGLKPILEEVIGQAAVPLEAARRESPMGNLLVDVMRQRAGADLAFQTPGGVRASLEAGPIEYGDAYAVMPLDNTITIIELTGAEVRQLLEQAAGEVAFLHVSGLRYAVDPGRPAGSRVSLRTPLDDGRTYRVSVSSFMAEGGDGLTLLRDRPRRDTGVLIRDALIDWIRDQTRQGRAIRAEVEGRIERLDGPG